MDLYSALTGIQLDREALSATVTALAAVESFDLDAIVNALRPYGLGEASIVQWGPTYAQQHCVWISGDVVALLLHGVNLPEDLPDIVLSSNQVSTVAVPGRIMSFTAATALGMVSAIDAAIIALAASHGQSSIRLVIAGHSHGGSLGLAYLTLRASNLPSVVVSKTIVTFGSPRALDPVASASLQASHTRIESLDDFIPRLPPYFWMSAYPIILYLPANELLYSHHGQGVGLDPTGGLGFLAPDNPGADPSIVGYIAGGIAAAFDPSPHLASTYAARLLASSSVANGVPSNSSFGDSAMAVYKLSTLFEQGPYGWSEVFYTLANNAEEALTIGANNTLLNMRRALLGGALTVSGGVWNPQIVAVRANNVFLQTDVAVRTVPPTSPIGLPTDVAASAANPNLCLLLRYRGTDGVAVNYSRNGYLRGVPDNISQAGGQYFPAGAFSGNLTAWFGQLLTLGIGLYLPNKNNLRVRNISIVQASNDILVTTATPHGLVTNDVVRITRVKPNAIVSGSYFVNTLSTTTYSLLNKTIPGVVQEAGFSQKTVGAFVTMSAMAPVRITKRSSGRPFFQPRGRRSAAVRA